MKRRQNNEAQLEKELGRFFRKLKKSVLKELNEYWSDYQLLQGQVNLMLSPIHEAHKEYYEIIRKYKLREYRLGKEEAKRLTKRANKDRVALKAVTTLGIQGFVDKDKNALFGTIPKAEEDLLNRTFRTSQNTLNRVDNQLNQIISDGYREGKGINQVANDITQRFDQLADWEARRIARTEINTSHNQATRDQYREDGVEYTQWIAANDDRTRDSHVDVDGEIIPIDGKYSNGLAFPGDTSGPIEEWINCRCSNAPFVIPYGFMAPSFSPFRESDLVPINTESLGEPSQEQLEANLSPEQRSQYEQYTKAVNEAQAVIDSKFSLPRERLQARTQLEYNLSKLNQLKLVANGELARGYQGIIGAVTTAQTNQEKTFSPKVQNQLDAFANTSREWKKEKHCIISPEGELLHTSKFGTVDSSMIDLDLVERLYDEYGQLHLDHNHPADLNGEYYTCLSDADCFMLLTGKTPETWSGDRWEYGQKQYFFKSITAESGNGSRMSLILDESFSSTDVENFHKAAESLEETHQKWLDDCLDAPHRAVDKKLEEYYAEHGEYPSLEESRSWTVGKEAKEKVLYSFEERLKQVQDLFKEANCTLKIEWV